MEFVPQSIAATLLIARAARDNSRSATIAVISLKLHRREDLRLHPLQESVQSMNEGTSLDLAYLPQKYR
jgi:hypothetical protein